MAKLSSMDKAHRRELKAILLAQGGELFAHRDVGVVIAVCPAVGARSNFALVGTAQVSPHDSFDRKTGEVLALERVLFGPQLSVLYEGRSNRDIAEQVLDLLAPGGFLC